MEEEDKEFFILVLGVLAAIVLVISWWFTTGGTVAGTLTTGTTFETAAHDNADEGSPGDDAGHDTDDDDAQDNDAHDTDADAATDATTDDPDADEINTAADDADDEAAATMPATVFDAIAANPDLSVISGLLRDSDLDQVLASDGTFTVFAPSNDAINQAASSDTTVTVLGADQRNVLTYHVVPGSYTVDDLADIARGGRSTELITAQGEALSLTLESGTVVINGSTTVSPSGQQTGNGQVHMIDNVLVPTVGALNALVAIDPILFATGSADIQPESFATLDSFIEILSGSNVDITIEGHTDSSGDPILNQNLSQSRARSVVNYLVANGVEEARLDAEGFGASRPVADNDSEEGRALNRRIEFTLG